MNKKLSKLNIKNKEKLTKAEKKMAKLFYKYLKKHLKTGHPDTFFWVYVPYNSTSYLDDSMIVNYIYNKYRVDVIEVEEYKTRQTFTASNGYIYKDDVYGLKFKVDIRQFKDGTLPAQKEDFYDIIDFIEREIELTKTCWEDKVGILLLACGERYAANNNYPLYKYDKSSTCLSQTMETISPSIIPDVLECFRLKGYKLTYIPECPYEHKEKLITHKKVCPAILILWEHSEQDE